MTITMAIFQFAAAFGMLGGSDTTKVFLFAGEQIDRVVANFLTPVPHHLERLFLFLFIGAGLLLAKKADRVVRNWATRAPIAAQVLRFLRSPLVKRHGKASLAEDRDCCYRNRNGTSLHLCFNYFLESMPVVKSLQEEERDDALDAECSKKIA